MAGSYQDQPNRKIAWDGDESVVYGAIGNDGPSWQLARGEFHDAVAAFTELSVSDKEEINGDNDGDYGVATNAPHYPYQYLYIIFPELRDIDGYYWNMDYSESTPHHFLSTSGDTTTGYDGTWDALGSEILPASGISTNSDYRKNIQPATASDVAGVLTQSSYYTGVVSLGVLRCKSLHLYGAIAAGETPDRLLFLDYLDSDVEFTKPIDYGNVGRGQTIIRRMTIKNNSSTLQANTVQITCEALYAGDGMFTYSTDGIADQATKALGNIAAGGTATVYIHMDIPDAQAVDLYQVRSSLTVASWT